MAFMEEVSQLESLVLICDGTNPKTETPVAEAEVYARAAETVQKADGLVVADFGPRYIDRLFEEAFQGYPPLFEPNYKLEKIMLCRARHSFKFMLK